MAYMNQETKKKLAPGIKAVLAEYGMKGTLSVRNHMVLEVNIRKGALDVAQDVKESHGRDYFQVNPYWFDEHYTGKTREFLGKLMAAIKGDQWYDNSDAMTDYFDTAYYFDINIGEYGRPYEKI